VQSHKRVGRRKRPDQAVKVVGGHIAERKKGGPKELKRERT